jgi:transcriptional regulator with XRE-family HTH domain
MLDTTCHPEMQLEMSHATEKFIMTGRQLRAARALLSWTGEQLAEAAGISLMTIRRAEATDGPLRLMPANLQALRAAFEVAGVTFTHDAGGSVGVWQRGATAGREEAKAAPTKRRPRARPKAKAVPAALRRLARRSA